MDSDYHDNDEGTYYGLDPFDPVAEEGNPPPVVEKIRSGEIRSEPNLFDYDRDRSASAAINMLVELLQNRETTVASEFLFYVSSRNFDFCKKLVGLLEDKSKPKGGSRVSEDELLATQRHFEDPAIGHLSATRRREIAGTFDVPREGARVLENNRNPPPNSGLEPRGQQEICHGAYRRSTPGLQFSRSCPLDG